MWDILHKKLWTVRLKVNSLDPAFDCGYVIAELNTYTLAILCKANDSAFAIPAPAMKE